MDAKPETQLRPRWSPRIPRENLQRLYESEAAGRPDEGLLDDVGIRLYLRCQSIRLVKRIQLEGLAWCQDCDELFPRGGERPDETLECPNCGRCSTWGEYRSTFRHHELAGTPELLDEFMSAWERARTPSQKMLAIDRAVHRWHHENVPGKELGRPFGVNLIEGSRKQVIAFLEALTFGNAGNDARWRQGLEGVRAAQRRDAATRRGHEA